VVSNLLRVRSLVKASRARLEEQRTHEFLNACSSGDLERMRTVRLLAAAESLFLAGLGVVL
jgi:hypothetical protein